MNRTLEVLHALVDLRAIARGNGLAVRMHVDRVQRRAPVQVRVTVGGIVTWVRRGEDAVAVLHCLVLALQASNVTARAYGPEP